jgi:hypothetical protein
MTQTPAKTATGARVDIVKLCRKVEPPWVSFVFPCFFKLSPLNYSVTKLLRIQTTLRKNLLVLATVASDQAKSQQFQ